MMTWEELHSLYSIHDAAPSNLEPRANISPTDPALVVRRDDGGNATLERMRWWFVPFFWKKTLREVPPTFNARFETVATTAIFRDAFERRRCIVPASGFYEWTGEKRARLPWYITATDGLPLSFAGLWDRWTNPETGAEIRSCTIITTNANRFMAQMHHRMPVILDAAGVEVAIEPGRVPAPAGARGRLAGLARRPEGQLQPISGRRRHRPDRRGRTVRVTADRAGADERA